LMPFSLTQLVNGKLAMEITIEKMDANVPVDEAVFKMPAKAAQCRGQDSTPNHRFCDNKGHANKHNNNQYRHREFLTPHFFAFRSLPADCLAHFCKVRCASSVNRGSPAECLTPLHQPWLP
ncbi:MAG: hypothetical protein ACLPWF_11105, partial [Bryobacteraceae bacterium]